MAERRMFTKKVTDSDDFVAMSSAAQALYLHLNQGADDDGFNNQVQMAMWKAHASLDDLKVLLSKRYIISFESGVIVVKHWRMHNILRKDRYTPTAFQEELQLLGIKGNGAYTVKDEDERLPSGCQVVAKRLPQVSIGKDSIDKVSIGEDICASPAEPTKPSAPQKHKYGEYKNVLLTDEEYEKLKDEFPNDYEERIERLSSYIASKGAKYKNHLATIRNWARKDREKVAEDDMATTNPFLEMLDEVRGGKR